MAQPVCQGLGTGTKSWQARSELFSWISWELEPRTAVVYDLRLLAKVGDAFAVSRASAQSSWLEGVKKE
jgi:hypothetical protein